MRTVWCSLLWGQGESLFLWMLVCLRLTCSELMDSIKNARYDPIPQSACSSEASHSDVCELLSRLLCVDPNCRLTSAQVRAHRWMSAGPQDVPAFLQFRVVGLSFVHVSSLFLLLVMEHMLCSDATSGRHKLWASELTRKIQWNCSRGASVFRCSLPPTAAISRAE